MLKLLLQIGLQRLVVPFPLLLIQIFHAYHGLSAVVAEFIYVGMYLTVMVALFLIEIALNSGTLNALAGWSKQVFVSLNILTICVGIAANIFGFYNTYWHQNLDRVLYWYGLVTIVLISVMFELLVLLVVNLLKKTHE